MTATSPVASSRQMFNPFNQPAQSSAPVPNPFASKPPTQGNPFARNDAADSSASNNARKNPFADVGASEGNQQVRNPFQAAIATQNANGGQVNNPFARKDAKRRGSGSGSGSEGSQQASKSSGRKDGKRRGSGKHSQNPFHEPKPHLFTTGTKQPNGRPGTTKPLKPLKPLPEDSSNKGRSPRRRSSTSSFRSSEDDNPTTSRSNDPHAKRVYEQLRKDGVSPPQWPSEPGQVRNKAAMTKFRESYEAYRTKARASLTKAGLIDDPDKRKALKDAIPFKGICEDMCPEFEKITRITESDVNLPEKNPRSGVPNTRRMVKKLARAAAGQEAPLPMDVRSVPALTRSLDYLIDTLLKNDANLPGMHGFLWDRTRAIRRDFTFFSSLTAKELKMQVYVLENIARFHVTALHLLSQDGKAPEDFVEQQELEQLGKALLSLRDVYDDCNTQGIVCEHEAEFRAYYLIFHANDPNIMEILQRQWSPKLWRESDDIRTAVSLVEAMQNTQDFHGPVKGAPSMAAASAFSSYFRIVEDRQVSYTMACFAEIHFPSIRRSILVAVKKALARPKEVTKDVTAAVLNRFLRFDTIQEAINFTELLDLEFLPDLEASPDIGRQYLVLNNRNSLPDPRLRHQFSGNLVEKKRGSTRLSVVIHQTVFEGSVPSQETGNGSAEESLFVPQQGSGSDNVSGGVHATPSWSNPQTISPSPLESQPSAKLPALNPFASSFVPPKAAAEAASESKPTESAPSFTNPFASASRPGGQEGASQLNKASTATKENSAIKPSAQLGSALSQPASSQTGSLSASPLSKPNPFAKAPPSMGISTTSQTPTGDETGAAGSGLNAPKPGVPAPFGTSPFPSNNSPATTKNTTPRSMFAIPPQDATSSNTASSSDGSTNKPRIQPAAEVPKNSSSILGRTETIPKPPEMTRSKPPPPPRQPSPPKDVLGDFTKWYVQGDNGLLEEFQIFMVGDILKGVFDKFKKDEERRIQKEEDERNTAKADNFRIYNLSLKMFYRWRDNAREKRLKELRRKGREQARVFYEAQRVADVKSRKEAARKAEKAKAQRAVSDRPKELMSILKKKKAKKASRSEAEEALLASGVLSGVANERDAIARIVRKEYDLPANGRSSPSPSVSSTTGGGAKTRAFRESFLGGTSSFRRSLPSMSSRDSASPETANRTLKVSERWRLKAMGIVQMPDGTAVPELLADEMAFEQKRYPGLRHDSSSRRASIADGTRPGSRLSQSQGTLRVENSDGAASPNKRKRLSDDDGAVLKQGDGQANSHKRVLSDAETLMSELRTMREEMEEGATWFKSQNERLQSEISRGSTPWDGSI